MHASFFPHTLQFIHPGGTSRGILHTKQTYVFQLSEGEKTGTGECGLFRGLSCDDVPDYKKKLQWLCENIHLDSKIIQQELLHFPSIWIGYEQARLNLSHGSDLYFPSTFTEEKDAITINGLIWMGNPDFMKSQIKEKLEKGFHCIKLKIGIDWASEKEILTQLRKEFSKDQLELRVDANGGFSAAEAKTVLQELAELHIHSIEQPIKTGNTSQMQELCAQTPIPIALDEELIGIVQYEEKKKLIDTLHPQYLILKPSLCGGFSGTDEWISLAQERKIGWWITSALESNIGLNAIAQYTFTKNPKIPQGLGTGALFSNNFHSKLYLKGDSLFHSR